MASVFTCGSQKVDPPLIPRLIAAKIGRFARAGSDAI